MSVLKLCLKIGSTIKLMVSKISIYIIERALKLDNVHTMKLNKEPGDCVLPWWRWPRERYGIMIDVGHGWHKKCHTLWLRAWGQAWIRRYLLGRMETQRPLMFTCLFVRLITRYQRWESRELSRGHKTIARGLAARSVSKHSGTLLEHGYTH